MNHAVCCVPVSPLRIEPSHKSEMVTQQLFGELCTIIEKGSDHWVKIKCLFDGYEGWCQDGHITSIEETQFNQEPASLTADWMNEVYYNDEKMILPIGCSLTGMEKGKASWKNNKIDFQGKAWNSVNAKKDEEIIRQIAFVFINTSYLWGGKSIYGIDCSGFTQTVYKFLNVGLPRDAYEQAGKGEVVGFLQEARCGDLAFFDNKEGKITHVGILLNDHEIIHASVKVRIDRIDSQGILNRETFERTHQLRIIKRYF
jgi:gamma-D-glutamyl-L-lysine dipeptidyl-peptidase